MNSIVITIVIIIIIIIIIRSGQTFRVVESGS